MVKQTVAAITPEECNDILAQISALVNRLQLRHGDNADANADDNDNVSFTSASRPPTPPPSDNGSTSHRTAPGPTTFSIVHDNSSGGAAIDVRTSGPTVIPILPNAQYLKASAYDYPSFTDRYSREYCEPFPAGPGPAGPSTAVAIAPIVDDRWYAVVRGKSVGVFMGWETVSPFVLHVSGSIYRRHGSRQKAEQAFEAALRSGDVAVIY
ncbi:hypothetical protein PUNSTDRAFT_48050 [Punctularia strigosozonata HHB-11173 SS5]|uniref:Ribonuclease H1 N-terminal domain-containing protein n=1 Tax=Punctularia strigosozonata (strain HHB-11173) TaxID=741275 RepID=R7RZQ5_PUNST|nr:uncharacterized protein PUNSTDRAFT_48050 [Punctularia strigosozonata HHB-11173 SS5]EIN03595.1 hypothetical protein PUNSTDRAFT_48050 [Punctularia strigosozonata HHB-11173 SS5]